MLILFCYTLELGFKNHIIEQYQNAYVFGGDDEKP
jgi:hypothetical protein